MSRGGRYPERLMGPTRVDMPREKPACQGILRAIEGGLAADTMPRVRQGASELLAVLCRAYRIPPLQVAVYDHPRPSLRGRRFAGELHGDYTPPGRIRIWARTAKRGQRVAFLTFLDTLLHEFLHHYDLTYLRLPDTVHSENFYKRLGSLRRLVERGQPAREAFDAGLSFDPIRQALAAIPEPAAAASLADPAPAAEATAPPPRRRPRPAAVPEQPLLPF